MISEKIELAGHIIDTGQLGQTLDDILTAGGDYVVERFVLGKTKDDDSYLRIEVRAPDNAAMREIMNRITQHGVTAVDPKDARLEPAPATGCSRRALRQHQPADLRRLHGDWVGGGQPGDGLCAGRERRYRADRPDGGRPCRRDGDRRHRRREGVGAGRQPLAEESVFEFMNSVVSSEKPQALLVRQIAQEMRDCKAAGKKVLWVGGPAIVHTGGADAMCDLVRAGYCDILFAGNALATHDIEAAMFGTSLGIDLSKGSGVEHGHEHHLRAINRVRGYGSIANAVAAGP